MARRGRKRKNGVKREPSGRVQTATPDQIRSVVLDQRKRLVGSQDARSELSGYVLGRLHLKNYVRDRKLVDAGLKWTQLVGTYCRIYGIPKPTPQACQMNVSYGIPIVAELPEDRIAAIKSEYHSAFAALMDAGMIPLRVTNDVCVNDAWPGDNVQGFVDKLNAGLNALACHFQIR